MAGRKSSWRKRRWELFLHQYQESPELQEALKDKRLVTPIGGGVKSIHYRILSRYGVPASCILAIQLYIRNPKLDESEYLKLIHPPVRFLNIAFNVIGPDVWGMNSKLKNESAYRPDNAIEFVYQRFGKVLREELGLGMEEVQAITKRIFGGSTVLFISPYTQKYEVKDFLDDYWDSQLKPLINKAQPDIDDLPQGAKYELINLQEEKLANKIYPAKTPTNWERDNYIMKLTEDGLQDQKIADALDKHPKFTYLEPNAIKQIRFRMKRNKKSS